MQELLRLNLLSPLVLAFVLGIVARRIRSDLSLPKDIYQGIAIYLLFAIGMKGGVELSHTPLATIAGPAAMALLLGLITPVSAFLVLRRIGRFSVTDAAAIAAHYGSVSAVTFIAAQEFVRRAGSPAEGYMPALLTILEIPGIAVALAIGTLLSSSAVREAGARDGQVRGGVYAMDAATLPAGSRSEALREVLTGKTFVLMVGGLLIGLLMGKPGWTQVQPFFETGFKGALCLFLLEMGVVAGARLGDLRRVGPFLVGFGVLLPLLHGALGVVLAHWAGMSVGGCTVLGTMAASASYIAAPPAVRTALPSANPTLYLTSALGITFPFNLVFGIPIYFGLARMIAG
ncbi:MAG TPA: sodium-dependent bicarbonate transport family permease [Longimicrobium sp.]|jgi:hypothetical protein|uniref:sodium-dependent bicarbonate transport family permease n=1 Tax=Longimicrobium sp. TaxID=2029185 RepID=UPI002EDADAFF